MADGSGKHLDVALVAAERTVWSGEARNVIARTTDGDVGILPDHAPLLGLLRAGVVEIFTPEGECYVAVAPAGFISVANNRVSILAEHAEMAHEIDLEDARRDLERARAAGAHEEDQQEHVAQAEARVRAAEMVV